MPPPAHRRNVLNVARQARELEQGDWESHPVYLMVLPMKD